MIAAEREKTQRVENNFLTSENGKYQIAKISVLQSDFNQFYDLLFKNETYIDKILYYHINNIDFSEIEEDLKPYFKEVDEKAYLKRENESLINFLKKTEKYSVDNLMPFLYLAQDDISRKTGDALQRRLFEALESRNIETAQEIIVENPNVNEAVLYKLQNDDSDIEDVLYSATEVFHLFSEEISSDIANAIVEKIKEIHNINIYGDFKSKNIIEIYDKSTSEFKNNLMVNYLASLYNESICTIEKLLGELNCIIPLFEKYSSNEDIAAQIKTIANFILESDNISADKIFNIIDNANENEFKKLWGLGWFKKLCLYINNDNPQLDEIKSIFMKSTQFILKIFKINNIVEFIAPLFDYSYLIPLLNSTFNETVCGDIDKKTATLLTEKLLSFDYDEIQDDEIKDSMFKILNKLKYEINDENQENFDNFFEYFENDERIDKILLYCGQNKYFDRIESAIKKVIDDLLDGTKEESLFKDIVDYFTDSQEEYCFSHLESNCSYLSNKEYSVELSLISILYQKDNFIGYLEGIAEKVLEGLESYFAQDNYFNFVNETYGYIKDKIHFSIIDKYVSIIIKMLPNHLKKCFEAIDNLGDKIPEKSFKDLYSKILDSSDNSVEGLLLNILERNNVKRPKEKENLIKLVKKLIALIQDSDNPNRIIKYLEKNFSNISLESNLINEAIKNDKVDSKILTASISKYLLKCDEKEIAKKIYDSLSCDEELNIWKDILYKCPDKDIKSIFDELVLICGDKTDINKIEIMLNLIEIFKTYANISQVKILLETSFEHINQLENISEMLNIVIRIKEHILKGSKEKKEFAEVLYVGFSKIKSNILKEKIIITVRELKIVRQFKLLLNEEELEYYKQNAK